MWDRDAELADTTDELEENVPDPQEFFTSSGWTITIGDDLPNCSSPVVSEGDFVCVSPLDKGRTETCVIATRHDFRDIKGAMVDWHWSRNKIVVRCVGVQASAVKSKFLAHCRHAMLKRITDNAVLERRATLAGGKFSKRWERCPIQFGEAA